MLQARKTLIQLSPFIESKAGITLLKQRRTAGFQSHSSWCISLQHSKAFFIKETAVTLRMKQYLRRTFHSEQDTKQTSNTKHSWQADLLEQVEIWFDRDVADGRQTQSRCLTAQCSSFLSREAHEIPWKIKEEIPQAKHSLWFEGVLF